MYPASGISQRGYCSTLTGRLAQPPAAAASRAVPAGQEPASVPAGQEPVDAPHSIQYADHSFPRVKEVEIDTNTFSTHDRFHFCEGRSHSETESKFPTGVNSPSFLESLRINTRIVATTSLSQLHVVVREEVKNMQLCALGSVNISSALHRATVLWKEHLDGLSGDSSSPAAPQLAQEARAAKKKVCLPFRWIWGVPRCCCWLIAFFSALPTCMSHVKLLLCAAALETDSPHSSAAANRCRSRERACSSI